MLSVHKTISVCQLALIALATIQGCGEGGESRKEGPGIIHAPSFNLLSTLQKTS